MANYSCISIGINRYHDLQPLSYAQADAQALQELFVEEVNLPLQQILLLSDSSTWVEEQPTYPTKNTILHWLRNLGGYSPGMQPSILWFFFSGYGVHHEGEDYLLPMDGSLRDIPGTGISTRYLLQALQAQGTKRILVILDINRSPGLLGRNSVGTRSLQLGQEMGISVLLSSQPGEFSHEAASLGHGMFTTALLEGLRYYRRDLTLANLHQYLCDRLPELSEHHWRPVQTPAMVFPSIQESNQPILPSLITPKMDWKDIPESNGYGGSPSVDSMGETTSNGTGSKVSVPVYSGSADESSSSSGSITPPVIYPAPQPPQPQPTPTPKPDVVLPPSAPFLWRQWRPFFLGIVTGGIFMALLMMLDLVNFPTNPSKTSQVPSSTDSTSTNNNSEPNSNPVPPDSTNNNQTDTSPSSDTTKNNQSDSNSQPSSDNTQQNTSVPTATSVGQLTLEEAKKYLQHNQASTFGKAIQKALLIPTTDPSYEQAQAAINRWSWVILDIAQGRATQHNFNGAIAAAKLIPSQEKSLYTVAQQSIQRWEIQKEQLRLNAILLQETKKQIILNQASSYNRAITNLRKINPGEPGYEEAQKLSNTWSKHIYLMANSRAARGSFQLAIQTAMLVPKESPQYPLAQKAIARWKQRKR